MASKGSILDVTKTAGEPPLGSSGIQIRFETDLITEGLRPGESSVSDPRTGPTFPRPARNISSSSAPASTTASRLRPFSRNTDPHHPPAHTMTRFFFILGSSFLALGLCATAAPVAPAKEEPFRPEAGKFPPLEKAHSYRGELVFVDHANRRGSIRVQGSGMFFRNDPHPFAMLPYGIVRYHGAPADLRDIPLGTVLHVRAFLPPDPKISAVPVLPINNKKIDGNHNRGAGIAPAENHVLLLEDEPSHCLREGMVWKLKEVDLKDNAGMIVASREPKAGGDGKASEEKMTFDAATRIWRGRECLGIDDLIAEGTWPAQGKKSSAAKPSCSASLGSPRRMACSPAFTSRTSGSMTTPRNVPRKIKPRCTRPSSAAAGCPPGSMPSSMASSAAPR